MSSAWERTAEPESRRSSWARWPSRWSALRSGLSCWSVRGSNDGGRSDDMSPAWHHAAADEVIAELGTGPAGLSESEARQRLATYGPNALPESRGRSWAAVFLGQFRSPLIYLLFVASAIALALG